MASLNDIERKIQNIIDILAYDVITGTLPLTFTSHTAGNTSDWEIRGNDEMNDDSINLFNADDFELIQVTENAYRMGTDIGILSQSEYTLTATKNTNFNIYLTNLKNNVYKYEEVTSFPYTFTADGETDYILRISDYRTYSSWAEIGYTDIMLVKGSTAPDHYIPYQQGVGEQRVDGYYVPLTISQQGQPDKTVDIYIGDSPLTEGETVSKNSTGVDIELFEGKNTISTTLYNKPKMTIKYKNNGGN